MIIVNNMKLTRGWGTALISDYYLVDIQIHYKVSKQMLPEAEVTVW